MAENSKIEWTHHTFNAWHGCAKVSPGCDNCYAERDSKRFNGDKVLWGVNAERLTLSDAYWKTPLKWNKRLQMLINSWERMKEAYPSFTENDLLERGFIKPEREPVFCASMADVFDKNAPEGARERLWALIKATPNLDWLLLTKRIGNAKDMLPTDWGTGYANVWLIISVVNQDEADRDIPKLLNTPAVIRGLSMEPLLGSVSIWKYLTRTVISYTNDSDHDEKVKAALKCNVVDWVIVGGESGSNARPMHPDWARKLRDQCNAAGVPFFFKQWGEWFPFGYKSSQHLPSEKKHCEWWHLQNKWFFGSANGFHLAMVKVGKKESGRFLDGVTHSEYPEVRNG